jgi:type IX secretion system PorP/SprF family membrane protein
MKTIISIAVIFIIPFSAYAQYVPSSAQNFHYATLYNPAFTGIENFVDFKFGYRYQWAGFKDNAPQFGNIAVNFRIKQPLDLKSNALRPSRTDFSRIVPRRKLSIHGLGLNAYSEMVGPILKGGAGIHYAMHMPISEKMFVSAGLGGMIENTRIDESKLYWGPNPDPDPIREHIAEGGFNHTEIWTRAGILFYSEKVYVGATYYPWNTTLKTSDIVYNQPYIQGGAQAGFSFPLNEDFEFKPSVWALWLTTDKWVIDYTAKFYMQDRAWFGLTYRDINAGAVSGGFNLSHMLSASYSYEFALGKLRTFGGGSHELLLAFRFKNYKRSNQRVW